MKRMLLLLVVFAVVAGLSMMLPLASFATDKKEVTLNQRHDPAEAAMAREARPRVIDPEILRLEQELQQARVANDMARFRNIGAALDERYARSRPAAPSIRMSDIPRELTRAELPPVVTGPSRWGDDALVYSGDLSSDADGSRQLALASDSTGTIYLAGCFVSSTGAGSVVVYRSTDNGETWSMVNGFVYGTTFRIQSVSMAVADTTGGHWKIGLVWVATTTSNPTGGGSIMFGSFLDDGSDWRYMAIEAATAATEYHNPSITTDGYYYIPSFTYWYVAAERRTPSDGTVRGACAFRSSDGGYTWPMADTNVSSWMDTQPQIAVHSGIAGSDTVYIASTRYYTSSKPEIRLLRNRYDFAGGTSTDWSYQVVTNNTQTDVDHSLAISTGSKDLLITYTHNFNETGDLDLMYAASSDKGTTWTTGTIAGSSSHNEWFSSAHCTWQSPISQPWYRIAYKVGSDSVVYATGNPPTNLAVALVNQASPSGVVRPVIGSHPAGAGLWNGGIAYAGWGPTNVYFDAADLSLAVEPGKGLPSTFSLDQNYPNPFNPSTHIAFEMPRSADVTVTIHNLLGQLVATAVNGRLEAGRHVISFDASHLATGVYLYRLSAGIFVETRKMLLLK